MIFSSGFLFPFIVLVIVLAMAFLYQGVKIVPQGFNYTVERFGRFLNILPPGLNVIIPFIDRVGARLDMRESVLDIPGQEVITLDNAMVDVDAVVFYQVMDAPKAAYGVSDLNVALLNLAMTNLRSVVGGLSLDDMLSNRDSINAKLLEVLDDAADPWGVKITRVEIKDIAPPRDLVDSMARQMKAERDKRATILTAEGEREAAIKTAEGMKQASILEAEGRREAAFRDAEARERAAKAEAVATRLVSDAIASGNLHAVNYFVAQKYIEALGTIGSAENQKVMFLPVEATSVIGSLGGIGEMAKAIFKDGKGGATQGSPGAGGPKTMGPAETKSETKKPAEALAGHSAPPPAPKAERNGGAVLPADDDPSSRPPSPWS